MRLKRIHGAALFVAATAAVAAVWIGTTHDTTSHLSQVRDETTVAERRPQTPRSVQVKTGNSLPASLPAAETPQLIAAQISSLEELAWETDDDSLKTILASLESPQAEIRAAAVAAVRTFGSRDAIPYLQARSRNTSDPLEQNTLAETVEYLELPTLVEKIDSSPRAEN